MTKTPDKNILEKEGFILVRGFRSCSLTGGCHCFGHNIRQIIMAKGVVEEAAPLTASGEGSGEKG